MSTEWDETTSYDAPFPLDVLRISVRNTFFNEWEIWNSDYIEGTTHGADEKIELNLGQWAEQEIQLVFEFHSGDAQDNFYGGVRIDGLSTYVSCAP